MYAGIYLCVRTCQQACVYVDLFEYACMYKYVYHLITLYYIIYKIYIIKQKQKQTNKQPYSTKKGFIISLLKHCKSDIKYLEKNLMSALTQYLFCHRCDVIPARSSVF